LAVRANYSQTQIIVDKIWKLLKCAPKLRVRKIN
jgi:hypothetical protein